MRALLPLGLLLFVACPTAPGGDDGGLGGGSPATCTACVSASDCPAQSSCVQYAGSDYCGHTCTSSADCGGGESCLTTSSGDGTQVMVCVPDNGTCGQTGCGTCAAGSVCDPIVGACVKGGAGGGGGGAGGGGASGTCGAYDLPPTPSCCSSCKPDAGNCQANGCYAGWWCDRNACTCHPASPGNCGGSGGGGPDAGPFTYTGSVGPDGGAVSALYFAIVGDTRPPVITPSALPTVGYPTAIITKIYQDIAALNPKPQFVISTGDYMYASPNGTASGPQLSLYMQARAAFPGPFFPTLGNHECTGISATNCPTTSTSNNLTSFKNDMLIPSGQHSLYYTFDVRDTSGQWTAKFVVTACNAWDATQKSWLMTQLARPTTYTFIVRHMPIASNGPCNTEMDAMLTPAAYTGLFTGHTHSAYFSSPQKMLVEGVGGAPITGTSNYGYATVQQRPGGGFLITQYDYSTNQPVDYWSL